MAAAAYVNSEDSMHCHKEINLYKYEWGDQNNICFLRQLHTLQISVSELV